MSALRLSPPTGLTPERLRAVQATVTAAAAEISRRMGSLDSVRQPATHC